MEKSVVVGDFWLDEQDPYEPTGIMYIDGTEEFDLCNLLTDLGVEGGCDSEKINKKRLRITVEVLDQGTKQSR